MSFLGRLFGKGSPPPERTWPIHGAWGALKNDQTLQTKDGPRFLWTVACGELELPSGRLVACDPFVFLKPRDNPFVQAPRGRFPVILTLADVSEAQDRSHIREAYASIVFSASDEKYRTPIPLLKKSAKRPNLKNDEFVGFGVDAGTACFVDDSVVGFCMPDQSTWYSDLFENNRPDCWFNRMDDPQQIRAGVANIVLPLAKNGENLILFHSGWGDGTYPLIGSFDASHNLVAAHIDFFVVR